MIGRINGSKKKECENPLILRIRVLKLVDYKHGENFKTLTLILDIISIRKDKTEKRDKLRATKRKQECPMSKYQEYAEKENEFLALTGYTRAEFDDLLPHFGKIYYEWMESHRLDGKPRGNRKYSDYQNSPLPTVADKLFFILHFLKTNNLQQVQGAMFGISQPKANVWIHCLHPLLNRTLAELEELPARQMEQMKLAESETKLYFHDGTERPIQRPTDPEEQRLYYSGKKTARGQE